MSCRWHIPGPITIVVNDIPVPEGADRTTTLAFHICDSCGQAFTHDALVLANMDATGKVALSGTLAQLPTGREIFDQLFGLGDH